MAEMLWGLAGAGLMLIITKVWERLQSNSDSVIDDLKADANELEQNLKVALKENSEEIKALTKALIKFEASMERLEEKIEDIPEMKKDINALGDKIRRFQIELKMAQ
jgi:septal ring factor EnvC (AmiA/AmiB activator)